jgi:transposase
MNTPRPDLSTLSSEQKDVLILALWDRLDKLEAMLLKNSSNSSKPPSSDGFKRKPKSRRAAGKASPGGQKGHPGSTLKRVAVVDEVQLHSPPARCDACGSKLDMRLATVRTDGRQVIDLPPVRVKVVEHRLQHVRCRCGRLHAGCYPEAVTQAVQYGPAIKAALVYLTQYQHVPMKRCTSAMQDLFGVHISPASVHAAIAQAHAAVRPIVQALSESMLHAPVVHFDETGMRVGKKLHWMHSASTDTAVVYEVHARRGREALQAFNLLPRFKGVAVHDGWPSYDSFKVIHALCNAHHLRELEFVVDSTRQQWAQDMIALLVQMNRAVDASTAAVLSTKVAAAYRRRYQRLLAQGRQDNPEVMIDPTRKDKRGGIKQSFARNLIRRLDERASDVLRFMTQAQVPFTNNLAERDIRMPKLKQKVSGCYRSFAGAQAYCAIRSYLGTLRKRSGDLMQALNMLFATHSLPVAG